MYLEKLEVHGFKSFANKNKLIFSGLVSGQKRGLTAIVGPNGSGKSNVADAIRWALGEQSLKTLRGKKSEDVIFSGSDQKTQLGLAEVSLYLNNTQSADGRVAQPETITQESDLDQLILSCPEIVITRRLYRNGDSEYLLNNSRVRLADIQMLLAKANFGQKTYSVIGQGMVENFLSTSAAERKDFFDEATGVKQFQIKRESALNKLENSYENLLQVDMLLSEIKPRLKSLTRQVEKLKRRDEIETALGADQREYYGFLWQDINTRLQDYNSRLLDQEKIKLDREKKLAKANQELDKIRVTDNSRAQEELQRKRQDGEGQKNQLLKQLAKLQASQEIQWEAQGQFDVSWLSNKAEELRLSLTALDQEIAALATAAPSGREEEISRKLKAINQKIEQAEARRRQITERENTKSQYLKQVARLEAILEANLEIQGQFDVSWLNNKQQELKASQRQLRQELAELKNQGTDQKEKSLNENLARQQKRWDELNSELTKINQTLKSGGEAGAKVTDLSRLIDEFLAELDRLRKENDLDKIKKAIAAAKQEFQIKIKTLLNGPTDDRLARIKDIQTEMIRLTEERRQTADDLNAERLKAATRQERERLLADQDREIEREIADIESKLAKADNHFAADKIQTEKIELSEKIRRLDQEILAGSAELRLPELMAQKETVTNELQEWRLQASAQAERQRLLEANRRQTVREIEDIAAKLKKAQAKPDDRQWEQEKEGINNQLAALNKNLATLAGEQAALDEARDREKAQLFEYQKNAQTLQNEINLISTELNNLKIEAARQETKLEDLEASLRTDGLKVADLQDYQPHTTAAELDRLQKELISYKNQLEQIGGIDPEVTKEYQETKERFDFLSGQVADLNQAIKSLEEIIYELDLNIKTRFDSEFKVISEKFNEYFKILFNGGQAKIFKLTAEDSENEKTDGAETTNGNGAGTPESTMGLTPAENLIKAQTDDKLKALRFLRKHNAVGLAGIEVQATPPGKKIQTVTMLSGGERALTAIALICAIISANPSPFVVLDEVDAALDEANSERLARILDDLSNQTQFIVITHNRACMRKANILYGVTMEADGVSKLLSVKLDELKNLK